MLSIRDHGYPHRQGEWWDGFVIVEQENGSVAGMIALTTMGSEVVPQGAAPEPPSVAPVQDGSETMNPKSDSEAPADDGGW